MNRLFSPINLLLSITLLASCTPQAPPQTESDTTAESAPAEVEVDAEPSPQELQDIWIAIDSVPGESSVLVNGKTNLPDGYVLILNACRYHQGPYEPQCRSVKDGESFQGSPQEVAVQDGEFSAELSPIRSVDEIRALLEKSWALEQEISEMSGIPIDESGLTYTSDFLVDAQVTVDVYGFVGDQPPEILEIIGEEGENLTGLIVEDGIGGKSIEYSVKIDI